MAVILTPAQQRKLRTLQARHARLEDKIGKLMSDRVEIEEQMAAVYHDPR